MAIEMSINMGDIKKRMLRANLDALAYISEDMLNDINQYVPMSSGALRNSGKVEWQHSEGTNSFKGEFNFTWDRPDLNYELKDGESGTIPGSLVTEYVYNGLNPVLSELKGKPVHIKNWTTPGTGDHWDKLAVDNELDNWKDKYTEAFMESFRTHKK